MLTLRDRARPSSTTSECQWSIPAPLSGAAFDKEKVNVRIVPSSGPARHLGYVTNPGDCAGVADGWYFDNAANPRKILSCPTTCQSITAGPDAEAYVTFGCNRMPATRN
jgi:hypothetical protein